MQRYSEIKRALNGETNQALLEQDPDVPTDPLPISSSITANKQALLDAKLAFSKQVQDRKVSATYAVQQAKIALRTNQNSVASLPDEEIVPAQLEKEESESRPLRNPFGSTPADTIPGQYLVKPGDTLSQISQDTEIAISDLAALNNITDANQIRAGQILTLTPPIQDTSSAEGRISVDDKEEPLQITEPTGMVTQEGRKIYYTNQINPDGSPGTSSEFTLGVTDPRINEGKPTHIPSIYKGKIVSKQKAIDIIVANKGKDPDTGRFIHPGGDPEKRSQSLQAFVENPDQIPLDIENGDYSSIDQRADEFGLPRLLFRRLIEKESEFKQTAVSGTRVKGIAQVTGKTMEEQLPGGDVRNAAHQLYAGAKYLAKHIKDWKAKGFGDQQAQHLATASYNTGFKRVSGAISATGKALPTMAEIETAGMNLYTGDSLESFREGMEHWKKVHYETDNRRKLLNFTIPEFQTILPADRSRVILEPPESKVFPEPLPDLETQPPYLTQPPSGLPRDSLQLQTIPEMVSKPPEPGAIAQTYTDIKTLEIPEVQPDVPSVSPPERSVIPSIKDKRPLLTIPIPNAIPSFHIQRTPQPVDIDTQQPAEITYPEKQLDLSAGSAPIVNLRGKKPSVIFDYSSYPPPILTYPDPPVLTYSVDKQTIETLRFADPLSEVSFKSDSPVIETWASPNSSIANVTHHQDGTWTAYLMNGVAIGNLREEVAKGLAAYNVEDTHARADGAPIDDTTFSKDWWTNQTNKGVQSFIGVFEYPQEAIREIVVGGISLQEHVDEWNKGSYLQQLFNWSPELIISQEDMKAFQDETLPLDNPKYAVLVELDNQRQQSQEWQNWIRMTSDDWKAASPVNRRHMIATMTAARVIWDNQGDADALLYAFDNIGVFAEGAFDSVGFTTAMFMGGYQYRLLFFLTASLGMAAQMEKEYTEATGLEATEAIRNRMGIYAIGQMAVEYAQARFLKFLLGGKRGRTAIAAMQQQINHTQKVIKRLNDNLPKAVGIPAALLTKMAIPPLKIGIKLGAGSVGEGLQELAGEEMHHYGVHGTLSPSNFERGAAAIGGATAGPGLMGIMGAGQVTLGTAKFVDKKIFGPSKATINKQNAQKKFQQNSEKLLEIAGYERINQLDQQLVNLNEELYETPDGIETNNQRFIDIYTELIANGSSHVDAALEAQTRIKNEAAQLQKERDKLTQELAPIKHKDMTQNDEVRLLIDRLNQIEFAIQSIIQNNQQEEQKENLEALYKHQQDLTKLLEIPLTPEQLKVYKQDIINQQDQLQTIFENKDYSDEAITLGYIDPASGTKLQDGELDVIILDIEKTAEELIAAVDPAVTRQAAAGDPIYLSPETPYNPTEDSGLEQITVEEDSATKLDPEKEAKIIAKIKRDVGNKKGPLGWGGIDEQPIIDNFGLEYLHLFYKEMWRVVAENIQNDTKLSTAEKQEKLKHIPGMLEHDLKKLNERYGVLPSGVKQAIYHTIQLKKQNPAWLDAQGHRKSRKDFKSDEEYSSFLLEIQQYDRNREKGLEELNELRLQITQLQPEAINEGVRTAIIEKLTALSHRDLTDADKIKIHKLLEDLRAKGLPDPLQNSNSLADKLFSGPDPFEDSQNVSQEQAEAIQNDEFTDENTKFYINAVNQANQIQDVQLDKETKTSAAVHSDILQGEAGSRYVGLYTYRDKIIKLYQEIINNPELSQEHFDRQVETLRNNMVVHAENLTKKLAAFKDAFARIISDPAEPGSVWVVRGNRANQYIVKPGETLADISNKFNIHVKNLIAFNNLGRTLFKGTQQPTPGTRLSLPIGVSDRSMIYSVEKMTQADFNKLKEEGEYVTWITEKSEKLINLVNEEVQLGQKALDAVFAYAQTSISKRDKIRKAEQVNSNEFNENLDKLEFQIGRVIQPGDPSTVLAPETEETYSPIESLENLKTQLQEAKDELQAELLKPEVSKDAIDELSKIIQELQTEINNRESTADQASKGEDVVPERTVVSPRSSRQPVGEAEAAATAEAEAASVGTQFELFPPILPLRNFIESTGGTYQPTISVATGLEQTFGLLGKQFTDLVQIGSAKELQAGLHTLRDTDFVNIITLREALKNIGVEDNAARIIASKFLNTKTGFKNRYVKHVLYTKLDNKDYVQFIDSDDTTIHRIEYNSIQSEMTGKIVGTIKKSAKHWLSKEQVKTKIATQFIGEGGPNSSTALYAEMYRNSNYGNFTNTGNYTSGDVIFIASNGTIEKHGKITREGISPVINQNLDENSPNFGDGTLNKSYKNIKAAMEAGASIVMDTEQHILETNKKGRPFRNTGELALARYLAANNYKRQGKTGLWKPVTPHNMIVKNDFDGNTAKAKQYARDNSNTSVYTMRPNEEDKIPHVNSNENFGNPWSAGGYQGTIRTPNIKTAVNNYRDWLAGNAHQNIAPERRKWILQKIDEGFFDNKELIYFKTGYESHADVLFTIAKSKVKDVTPKEQKPYYHTQLNKPEVYLEGRAEPVPITQLVSVTQFALRQPLSILLRHDVNDLNNPVGAIPDQVLLSMMLGIMTLQQRIPNNIRFKHDFQESLFLYGGDERLSTDEKRQLQDVYWDYDLEANNVGRTIAQFLQFSKKKINKSTGINPAGAEEYFNKLLPALGIMALEIARKQKENDSHGLITVHTKRWNFEDNPVENRHFNNHDPSDKSSSPYYKHFSVSEEKQHQVSPEETAALKNINQVTQANVDISGTLPHDQPSKISRSMNATTEGSIPTDGKNNLKALHNVEWKTNTTHNTVILLYENGQQDTIEYLDGIVSLSPNLHDSQVISITSTNNAKQKVWAQYFDAYKQGALEKFYISYQYQGQGRYLMDSSNPINPQGSKAMRELVGPSDFETYTQDNIFDFKLFVAQKFGLPLKTEDQVNQEFKEIIDNLDVLTAIQALQRLTANKGDATREAEILANALREIKSLEKYKEANVSLLGAITALSQYMTVSRVSENWQRGPLQGFKRKIHSTFTSDITGQADGRSNGWYFTLYQWPVFGEAMHKLLRQVGVSLNEQEDFNPGVEDKIVKSFATFLAQGADFIDENHNDRTQAFPLNAQSFHSSFQSLNIFNQYSDKIIPPIVDLPQFQQQYRTWFAALNKLYPDWNNLDPDSLKTLSKTPFLMYLFMGGTKRITRDVSKLIIQDIYNNIGILHEAYQDIAKASSKVKADMAENAYNPILPGPEHNESAIQSFVNNLEILGAFEPNQNKHGREILSKEQFTQAIKDGTALQEYFNEEFLTGRIRWLLAPGFEYAADQIFGPIKQYRNTLQQITRMQHTQFTTVLDQEIKKALDKENQKYEDSLSGTKNEGKFVRRSTLSKAEIQKLILDPNGLLIHLVPHVITPYTTSKPNAKGIPITLFEGLDLTTKRLAVSGEKTLIDELRVEVVVPNEDTGGKRTINIEPRNRVYDVPGAAAVVLRIQSLDATVLGDIIKQNPKFLFLHDAVVGTPSAVREAQQIYGERGEEYGLNYSVYEKALEQLEFQQDIILQYDKDNQTTYMIDINKKYKKDYEKDIETDVIEFQQLNSSLNEHREKNKNDHANGSNRQQLEMLKESKKDIQLDLFEDGELRQDLQKRERQIKNTKTSKVRRFKFIRFMSKAYINEESKTGEKTLARQFLEAAGTGLKPGRYSNKYSQQEKDATHVWMRSTDGYTLDVILQNMANDEGVLPYKDEDALLEALIDEKNKMEANKGNEERSWEDEEAERYGSRFPTFHISWKTQDNARLSNLANRPFAYTSTDNISRQYQSVEHAYQSLKSGTFDSEVYHKKWGHNNQFSSKKRTNTKDDRHLILMEKLIVTSLLAKTPEAKEAVALLLESAKDAYPITHDGEITEFTRIMEDIRVQIAQGYGIDGANDLTQTIIEDIDRSVKEDKNLLYSIKGLSKGTIHKTTSWGDITANNVKSLFDQFKTFSSGYYSSKEAMNEHTTTLEMILGKVNEGMTTIGGIPLTLEHINGMAQGEYDMTRRKMQISLSHNPPYSINSQSPQEVYVHELVHAMTFLAIRERPLAAKRIRKLYDQIENQLNKDFGEGRGYQVFLSGIPKKDWSRQDILIAKKQYNYLFQGKEENKLHEFLAYAVTNQRMVEYLKKQQIADLQTRPTKLLAQLIEEIFKLIDIIREAFGQKTYKNVGGTAFSEMVAATEHLVALQVKHEARHAYYQQRYKHIDKLDRMIKEFVANKARQWSRSRLDEHQNMLEKARATIAGHAYGMFSEDVAKQQAAGRIPYRMSEIVDMAFSKTLRGIAKELGDGPMTPDMKEQIMHVKVSISKRRQAEEIRIQRLIDGDPDTGAPGIWKSTKSNDPHAITVDTRKSLTKIIFRTDLSALLYKGITELEFSHADIMALLGKQAEKTRIHHRDVIARILGISHDHPALRYAKELGANIALGNTYLHGAHMNAATIAVRHLTKTYSPKQEALLNMYATLSALDYTNPTDTNSVKELSDAEFAADAVENGMTELLDYHRAYVKQSRAELFAGNPMQMVKGYIVERVDEYTDMQVGPGDKKTIQEMKQLGYTKHYPLTTIHKNQTVDTLYVTTSIPDVPDISGVMSTTNKRHMGTTIKEILTRDPAFQHGPTHRHAGLPDWVAIGRAFNAFMKTQEALARRQHQQGYQWDSTLNLRPVTDDTGAIIDYRVMLNHQTMEEILDPQLEIQHVFAHMTSSLADRKETIISDKKTVELLVQEQMGMMSAYHNTIHWVNIMDPNNPYIDRYRKLPQEVREHMQKYALKGKFPVREDIIDKVFGYKAFDFAASKVAQSHLHPIARRVAGLGHHMMKGTVGYGKNRVVIAMPRVIINNMLSNVYQLIMRKIPIEYIFYKVYEGLQEYHRYTEDSQALEALKAKIRAKELDTKTSPEALQRDRLQARLEGNLVHPLIRHGLASLIVEDINDAQTTGYFNKLRKLLLSNQQAAKIAQKIPNKMGEVAQTLFITKKSKPYQYARHFVQMTDFLGRYVFIEYATKVQGKPFKLAMHEAVDAFVLFDEAVLPIIEALDVVGVTSFVSYWLRNARSSRRIVQTSPSSVALSAIVQEATGVKTLGNINSSWLYGDLAPNLLQTDDLLNEASNVTLFRIMADAEKDLFN